MEAYEAIMTRRSVRNFTDRKISDEDLKKILHAAMAGPSCANTRAWSFIVVRDKDTLNKMADANGGPAVALRGSDVGVLICGNLERAFKPAPDYWIIDGAIAGQNMCLAAHAMGLGAVWLGTYPEMNRVENQIKLFGLPETQRPHSVIAFGYPDPDNPDSPPPPPKTEVGKAPSAPPRMIKGEYEPECVHFEKW